MVAGADEEEGEDHAGGCRPRIEEHAREQVGVAIGLDHEIIGFNVDGGEEEVEKPLAGEDHVQPGLEPVAPHCVRSVDGVEEEIHEERLKGGHLCASRSVSAFKGKGEPRVNRALSKKRLGRQAYSPVVRAQLGGENGSRSDADREQLTSNEAGAASRGEGVSFGLAFRQRTDLFRALSSGSGRRVYSQEPLGEDTLQALSERARERSNSFAPNERLGLQRLTIPTEEGVDDTGSLDYAVICVKLDIVLGAAGRVLVVEVGERMLLLLLSAVGEGGNGLGGHGGRVLVNATAA